jgi:hypothetical protein
MVVHDWAVGGGLYFGDAVTLLRMIHLEGGDHLADGKSCADALPRPLPEKDAGQNEAGGVSGLLLRSGGGLADTGELLAVNAGINLYWLVS